MISSEETVRIKALADAGDANAQWRYAMIRGAETSRKIEEVLHYLHESAAQDNKYGQYFPKRMCFEVFGEERIKEFNIQVMDTITISFDIDAREYNGRWYNSMRAWKVTREALPTPSAIVTAPESSPLPPINDLPWEANDVAIKNYPF